MTALNTSPSWNVGKSSGRCAACQTELPPNTPCWAALCDAPRPQPSEIPKPKDAKEVSPFLRLDFCESCWANGKRPEQLAPETLPIDPPPAAPLTMFSFWKTTVPIPQQKKKLLVDDSVLLDLFHRMQDKSEPQEIRFRFVLALILMRKRLLKYESTETPHHTSPGGDQHTPAAPAPTFEIWRMIPRIPAAPTTDGTPATGSWGEPVKVTNPHLTADQITEVSQQLSAILAEEI